MSACQISRCMGWQLESANEGSWLWKNCSISGCNVRRAACCCSTGGSTGWLDSIDYGYFNVCFQFSWWVFLAISRMLASSFDVMRIFGCVARSGLPTCTKVWWPLGRELATCISNRRRARERRLEMHFGYRSVWSPESGVAQSEKCNLHSFTANVYSKCSSNCSLVSGTMFLDHCSKFLKAVVQNFK